MFILLRAYFENSILIINTHNGTFAWCNSSIFKLFVVVCCMLAKKFHLKAGVCNANFETFTSVVTAMPLQFAKCIVHFAKYLDLTNLLTYFREMWLSCDVYWRLMFIFYGWFQLCILTSAWFINFQYQCTSQVFLHEKFSCNTCRFGGGDHDGRVCHGTRNVWSWNFPALLCWYCNDFCFG